MSSVIQPKYSFDELLRFFLYLQHLPDHRRLNSQKDLAEKLGIAENTVSDWCKGVRIPQRQQTIEAIAEVLELSAIETELLLFSAKEKWVKFGTSSQILQQITLLCYSTAFQVQLPVGIEVESVWSNIFVDDFDSNINHWCLGVREDSFSQCRRMMKDKNFQIEVHNKSHFSCINIGDSSCFSTETCLVSAEVLLKQSSMPNSYCGLVFEGLNSYYNHGFYINQSTGFAIICSFNELHQQEILFYEKSQNINQSSYNKLSIIIHQNRFLFFINNKPITTFSLKRQDRARLDLGVITDKSDTTLASFRNFRVKAPFLKSDL